MLDVDGGCSSLLLSSLPLLEFFSISQPLVHSLLQNTACPSPQRSISAPSITPFINSIAHVNFTQMTLIWWYICKPLYKVHKHVDDVLIFWNINYTSRHFINRPHPDYSFHTNYVDSTDQLPLNFKSVENAPPIKAQTRKTSSLHATISLRRNKRAHLIHLFQNWIITIFKIMARTETMTIMIMNMTSTRTKI